MTIPTESAPTPPPPAPTFAPPPPAPADDASSASASRPQVARAWSGALLAVAALTLAVGSCLTWEKLVVFVSGRVIATLSLTGLGSVSTTGDPAIRRLVSAPGANGKFEIGIAAVLLVAAVLVMAGRGRRWIGIVSAASAATALVVAVLNVRAVSSDGRKLDRFIHDHAATGAGHALTRIGLDITLIGAAAAVVAALLVLFARRRRSA